MLLSTSARTSFSRMLTSALSKKVNKCVVETHSLLRFASRLVSANIDKHLETKWSDGVVRRYPYVFLRDNCLVRLIYGINSKYMSEPHEMYKFRSTEWFFFLFVASVKRASTTPRSPGLLIWRRLISTATLSALTWVGWIFSILNIFVSLMH